MTKYTNLHVRIDPETKTDAHDTTEGALPPFPPKEKHPHTATSPS